MSLRGAKRLATEALEVVRESLPAAAKTRKPGKPGKRLELAKIADLEKHIADHLSDRSLLKLALKKDEFVEVLHEVERRLGEQRATVDQLVGTVLEVIGPNHPIALDIRKEMVRVNLESLLHSHAIGEAAFIPAGTNLAPVSLHATGATPAWRSGGPGVEPIMPQEAAKLSSGAIETLIGVQYAALDKRRVTYVRDLAINGSDFCDRAVLLKLEGGKWALLLSEEYKTVGSGGVNPQVAIRDNRLFNENVSADSKLTFYTDRGREPVKINLSDLLVNVNTTTTDKFALKASGRTRYEQRCLKVTRGVKERKTLYGDARRLNEDANVSYLFIGLQYPSGPLRRLMEALQREGRR